MKKKYKAGDMFIEENRVGDKDGRLENTTKYFKDLIVPFANLTSAHGRKKLHSF